MSSDNTESKNECLFNAEYHAQQDNYRSSSTPLPKAEEQSAEMFDSTRLISNEPIQMSRLCKFSSDKTRNKACHVQVPNGVYSRVGEIGENSFGANCPDMADFARY